MYKSRYLALSPRITLERQKVLVKVGGTYTCSQNLLQKHQGGSQSLSTQLSERNNLAFGSIGYCSGKLAYKCATILFLVRKSPRDRFSNFKEFGRKFALILSFFMSSSLVPYVGVSKQENRSWTDNIMLLEVYRWVVWGKKQSPM